MTQDTIIRPPSRRRFLLSMSERLRGPCWNAVKLFDSAEEAKQWVKNTFQGTDYVWLEQRDSITGHFEAWCRLYVEIHPTEVLE